MFTFSLLTLWAADSTRPPEETDMDGEGSHPGGGGGGGATPRPWNRCCFSKWKRAERAGKTTRRNSERKRAQRGSWPHYRPNTLNTSSQPHLPDDSVFNMFDPLWVCVCVCLRDWFAGWCERCEAASCPNNDSGRKQSSSKANGHVFPSVWKEHIIPLLSPWKLKCIRDSCWLTARLSRRQIHNTASWLEVQCSFNICHTHTIYTHMHTDVCVCPASPFIQPTSSSSVLQHSPPT